MFRRIITTILTVIIMSGLVFAVTPQPAEAKSSHGITISKKGGMAQKCRKHQIMHFPSGSIVCPKKGYIAFMRSGESFRDAGNYFKFYKSKKKALRASERSLQNKYLPTCLNKGCTRVRKFY